MSKPEVDDILFVYIALASYKVSLVLVWVDVQYIALASYKVSLVLVWVDVQRPIYYVSKSLHEVEVHYLPLEKAILAVVHATRKLPHSFQSHTIIVLTQLPLRSLLRSVDYTGRIAKWGTILGTFDIKYMPCISIEG